MPKCARAGLERYARDREVVVLILCREGLDIDGTRPPNAEAEYDYYNLNLFDSDITDWKPDGSGIKIPYSAAIARDTPYILPNSLLPPPRPESHWYVYWRQSMPGLNNSIPYETSSATDTDTAFGQKGRNEDGICIFDGDGFRTITISKPEMNRSFPFQQKKDRLWPNPLKISSTSPAVSNRMTNWWHFMGDWDRAITAGVGLYEPVACSYTLSASEQNFPANGGNGSVNVTASPGCKWFASNNAPWTPLISGDIGNGGGTVDQVNVLCFMLCNSRA